MNYEGDLFRTRLTHSLEVAQLGRSIARTRRLSENLVEAIALAHDLGHTPFGHVGQDALNACLKIHNAQSADFEHNLQSLRVADTLQERYLDGSDSAHAAGAKPERVVADYIADMTERFATKEHERLKGRVAFPV